MCIPIKTVSRAAAKRLSAMTALAVALAMMLIVLLSRRRRMVRGFAIFFFTPSLVALSKKSFFFFFFKKIVIVKSNQFGIVSQPSATSTNTAEAFKAEWLEWLAVAIQAMKTRKKAPYLFRLNEAQLNLALSLVPKKGKWAQAKWWLDRTEFNEFYRMSKDGTRVKFDFKFVYTLITLVCYFE